MKLLVALLRLLTSVGTAYAATGWHEWPATHLADVCPADNFGGIPYAFGGSSPSGKCALGVYRAWSGAAMDSTNSRLIIWGGGHTDYSGNEVYSFNNLTHTLTRITDPSDFAANSGCPDVNAADGTPVSRHSYNGLAYMAAAARFFSFSSGIAPCGENRRTTWLLNLAGPTWTGVVPSGYDPSTDGSPSSQGPICAYYSVDQAVYCNQAGNFGIIQKFTHPSTYAKLTAFGSSMVNVYATSAIDPINQLWLFVGTDLSGILALQSISLASGSTYAVTDITSGFTGCSALAVPYPGLTYDSYRRNFVAYPGSGDTVYEILLGTQQCVAHTFPGGPAASSPSSAGIFGRFAYDASTGTYIVAVDANANVFTLTLDERGTGIGGNGGIGGSGAI